MSLRKRRGVSGRRRVETVVAVEDVEGAGARARGELGCGGLPSRVVELVDEVESGGCVGAAARGGRRV